MESIKSNLPIGADNDMSAPYNEPRVPKPLEANVLVSQTFSKSIPIKVYHHILEQKMKDDEGCSFIERTIDEKEVDWKEEFDSNTDVYNISKLLDVLYAMADANITSARLRLAKCSEAKKKHYEKRIAYYEKIRDSCLYWDLDDEEYIKD